MLCVCLRLQVSVNDKFASLSEALYIAERQAREEIRLRNEVKKQKKIREEELREQQLRQLAAQARAERSAPRTTICCLSLFNVLDISMPST